VGNATVVDKEQAADQQQILGGLRRFFLFSHGRAGCVLRRRLRRDGMDCGAGLFFGQS
jgi:hypothetical protein